MCVCFTFTFGEGETGFGVEMGSSSISGRSGSVPSPKYILTGVARAQSYKQKRYKTEKTVNYSVFKSDIP